MTDGSDAPTPPPQPQPAPPPLETMSVAPLRPVAISLVVYNALSVVSGLVGVVAVGFVRTSMDEAAKKQPELKQLAELYHQPWLSGLNWIGLLLSIAALVGSIFALRARNYGLAMTGVIVTMLNPGGCCCCLIGTALGIWGLVVLLKPEVQAAFNRP